MKYRFIISNAHRCIFAKWHGRFSADGALAFFQALERDPNFSPGLNRLMDLREFDLNVPTAEMQALARLTRGKDHAHGQRNAVFMVDSAMAKGMTRVFMAFAEGGDARFQHAPDFATALRRLRLPDDLADPFEAPPFV